MSVAIDIQNLTKEYRIKKEKSTEVFKALDDISLQVKAGDAVGIIGSNGAGKSTLLKILSQITYPTSGRAIINGRITSLLEVGTGFHPDLSGVENIYLNGSILGLSRKEIKVKLDEIIDFSGIENFIYSPVKHYSSGMYVRLAFSVAAHLNADILLMDEVLAVGDAQFQQKCLQKMDDTRNKEGRTVIFVSHNLNDVRQLCTKAIWLEEGKLKASGSSEEICNAYIRSLNTTAKLVPLMDRTDRKGTGDTLFTDLFFTEDILISGTSVDIKMAFTSPNVTVITNLRFSLYIHKENGEFVTALDNEMSHYSFTQAERSGKAICHISKLPLSAGRYYMNANIYVNGIRTDRVKHALYFEVHGGDFYSSKKSEFKNQQGAFIEQQWELQD